jgi:hypothetical protein
MNMEDMSKAAPRKRAETTAHLEFVPNFKNPAIRAQSILVLAKHWKPFDPSNYKSVKTEEEGFMSINALVTFIGQMLEKISQSKSLTIDAYNQGTWMHLLSLYHLGIRFGGVLKEPIKAKLKEIKKQFEKTSKRIIIENEIRIIQGLLSLIKEVLRFQISQEDGSFITESE